MNSLRRAAAGPALLDWSPPPWLLEHQIPAARRIAAALRIFRGALLADAVGLGKTYVALAVSLLYRRTAVAAPAALLPQWRRTAARLGLTIAAFSHESLSRSGTVPETDLLIVDEAHRFRNPETRRYDRLVRGVRRAHVLLVTATPLVNRPADLVSLLRIFLSDHGLALLGVPSLDGAARAGDHGALLQAVAPLVVARPAPAIPAAMAALPRARDGRVQRPPPVAPGTLRRMVALAGHLRFPGFDGEDAAALLRRHLLHRLASSAAAFRETVGRHMTYVDRAIRAAGRGERLSRLEARWLYGPDEDPQLEFEAFWTGADAHAGDRAIGAADLAAVRRERDRLRRLAAEIPGASHPHPKLAALRRQLVRRAGRKTLVFTTAVATALDAAEYLGWRRVAVVAGGRARIASGPVSVEEALSLFAPRARGAPVPGAAAAVDVLIATDLASEGLDLQDADAVVHFDLPWTPVRLAQRLGRIARLGSPHGSVDVLWFAPPRILARPLGLEEVIRRKARTQLALGVAATSRVGRATVVNDLLAWRERLATLPERPVSAGGFAVVRGEAAACLALHWLVGDVPVPQLLVLRGRPPQVEHDYGESVPLVESLETAHALDVPPPEGMLRALRDLVRRRLAAAGRGPATGEARRLARRLLRAARTAARRRDSRRLCALDAALDQLGRGLPVGAERELEAALARLTTGRLEAWVRAHGCPAREGAPACRLVAALFGVSGPSGTPDQVPAFMDSGVHPQMRGN